MLRLAGLVTQRRHGGEVIYSLALPAVRDLLAAARQILQAKNADGATVLTKQPDAQAFTNEYVTKALETLKGEGVDVVGSGFTPETVTLNAGGA